MIHKKCECLQGQPIAIKTKKLYLDYEIINNIFYKSEGSFTITH
jgi:hypothetical protein